MTATLNHIMNSILAQASFPPGTFNLMLYGVGAAVLLDGEWMPDPRASETVPNPFGEMNSVLKVN